MMAPALEISTESARLDVDLIHGFLNASYWAAGRPRELVERSIRNSLCFGAYTDGRQVGFGRVITDRAVFAYMADVFVIPEYRGRGIAKAIVQAMIDHADLQDVKVFLLRTQDAHGLYEQFGFQPVPNARELLGRYR